MKANYEDKLNTPTSEVNLGNLYDINKQLMDKEPEIDKKVIENKTQELKDWFAKNFSQKYFMLLCHEMRDFTLFNLDKTNTWKNMVPSICAEAAIDIIDCLQNRGSILAIQLQDDGTWELWIRNTQGCFAYYLFPYGAAVIEY